MPTRRTALIFWNFSDWLDSGRLKLVRLCAPMLISRQVGSSHSGTKHRRDLQSRSFRNCGPYWKNSVKEKPTKTKSSRSPMRNTHWRLLVSVWGFRHSTSAHCGECSSLAQSSAVLMLKCCQNGNATTTAES